MSRRFWDSLVDLYASKQWKKLALYIIGAVIAIICSALLFWMVVALILRYWDTLIFVIGIPVILWYKLHSLPPTSLTTPPVIAPSELTYGTLRQLLFDVLQYVSEVLSLACPRRLNELDSPSRYLKRGNVILCEFLVLKKPGAEVITENAVQVLQTRIHQLLTSGEVCDLAPTVYVHTSGRTYDIAVVDKVTDVGGHLAILMTIANKEYGDQLIYQAHARQQAASPIERDYHDQHF